MTIKSKISSALLFMFAILIAIGGLAAYYLTQLSNDSQAILKDNYESLEYASNMQKALADLRDPDAVNDFDSNLKKEEANITEPGERGIVVAIRREFSRIRKNPADTATLARLRQHLFSLDDINRQATFRKNNVAKQTAKDALLWLASVGTLCFLILFSFIVSFPGYIANPLRELTQGIRQVASRNFEERLHFRSGDEFGELARSFNSMAQKLDEYEHSNLASVLFEKRRIDTLIQIMNEGIIGLDENRRILFANPVACRLLGVKDTDIVGQYAPDVAAANDLMRTLIQDVMASQTPTTESTMLKIFDPQPYGSQPHGNQPFGSSATGVDSRGKESYFNRRTHVVDVTRTGEEQSQLAGYVIVLENITSFKELDLAKTNFIATVSHELKTPLSSLKMSLQLLDDSRIGQINDEQRQLLGNIRADADRLLGLTGELLNMAQVESGQIQLNMQAVQPAEIVRYAADALRVQAVQKNIKVRLNLPPTLPPVLADPDKASWVLINFLSNALRHSPTDTTIDISVAVQNKAVEFRVRDHGAGIRPEHRDRVFDRYFKAPGSSGQASGTGLGLAISSEFIQSMNGQIGLDTTVTDGATFYFRLPVA